MILPIPPGPGTPARRYPGVYRRFVHLALLTLAASRLWAAPFEVRVVPDRVGQGRVFAVAVTASPDAGRPSGTYRDRTLLFFPGKTLGEWSALGGVDLEDPPGPASVEVRAGGATARADFAIEAGTYPVDRLRFKVGPSDPEREAAIEKRVAADQARAREAGLVLTDEPFPKGLKLPVKGRVSSSFGRRRVINGTPRQPHGGTDIAAPTGRLVRAAAAGTVRLVDDMFFSGNTVIVDHGAGWMTTYFHLSSIWVKEGETVGPKSVLGRVGRTGRATGPHLHWGLQWQRARLDPLKFWPPSPDRVLAGD